MLDINLLLVDRGGNPETVKESQRRRGAPVEIVDEIIALYKEWVKSKHFDYLFIYIVYIYIYTALYFFDQEKMTR